jgi:dihydrodipicolinate synthase/N-acetylneuraminate lyase
MPVELFERLWADYDNVRAIKWATFSEAETMEGYVSLASRYAMVNNGPGLPQAALLGASGFVTHLANVWPEHEVTLWKRFMAGEVAEATDTFLRVNWPWRGLRVWAHTEIAGGESLLVKPAAEMTGFHGGPNRPPMVDLNRAQRAEVRSVLERIGVPLI